MLFAPHPTAGQLQSIARRYQHKSLRDIGSAGYLYRRSFRTADTTCVRLLAAGGKCHQTRHASPIGPNAQPEQFLSLRKPPAAQFLHSERGRWFGRCRSWLPFHERRPYLSARCSRQLQSGLRPGRPKSAFADRHRWQQSRAIQLPQQPRRPAFRQLLPKECAKAAFDHQPRFRSGGSNSTELACYRDCSELG
jgi:hypothetical protein